MQTLEEIFLENIAPALAIKADDASISNGMCEEVAKNHRDFANASDEEKTEMLDKGIV